MSRIRVFPFSPKLQRTTAACAVSAAPSTVSQRRDWAAYCVVTHMTPWKFVTRNTQQTLWLSSGVHSVLNVKALLGAFNQDKALVVALSVIMINQLWNRWIVCSPNEGGVLLGEPGWLALPGPGPPPLPAAAGQAALWPGGSHARLHHSAACSSVQVAEITLIH